jgi:hypothetical protein
VVRVVPDIEREEFLNAGLILFCRPRRYLAARTHLDADALLSLAAGTVSSGPFATMSQSERFHWLTTPRSTIVQPGPLHPGTTEDPAATFEHLYRVLVER